MKIVNILLGLLFALFTYFQLNDPDPWLWIAIYSIVALVCAFAAFGLYNRWLIILIFIGLSIYWGILLPSFVSWVNNGMPSITGSMKAETPHVEYVREFLGLMILMAVLIWQYAQSKKNRNNPTEFV